MSSDFEGGQKSWRAGGLSRAFLLRCWQEADGEGELSWRFSLTQIDKKREVRGYTDLEAVTAYLHQILNTGNSIHSEGEQS